MTETSPSQHTSARPRPMVKTSLMALAQASIPVDVYNRVVLAVAGLNVHHLPTDRRYVSISSYSLLGDRLVDVYELSRLIPVHDLIHILPFTWVQHDGAARNPSEHKRFLTFVLHDILDASITALTSRMKTDAGKHAMFQLTQMNNSTNIGPFIRREVREIVDHWNLLLNLPNRPYIDRSDYHILEWLIKVVPDLFPAGHKMVQHVSNFTNLVSSTLGTEQRDDYEFLLATTLVYHLRGVPDTSEWAAPAGTQRGILIPVHTAFTGPGPTGEPK